MAKALVTATDPTAQAGGEAILDDGGSASDAVVCAVLSSGTAHPGVLLGPVVSMVGGVGVGTRLFDGRTCQPGLGHKRPRGFKPHETIPFAARCAVPRSFGALALMHAYTTKRPLSALIRCASSAAKRAQGAPEGLEERLGILAAFARHGATTLAQQTGPLLRVAGTAAGGLLTERDLTEARPGDERPDFVGSDGAEWARPAWRETPREAALRDLLRPRTHVVAAADGWGQVAAACYLRSNGLSVPELGMDLPFMATPVMRGVPRVTPTTPQWAPTPIALMRRADDGWFAAAGVAGADGIEIGSAQTSAPLEQQAAALRDASGGTRAIIAWVERSLTGVATS